MSSPTRLKTVVSLVTLTVAMVLLAPLDGVAQGAPVREALKAPLASASAAPNALPGPAFPVFAAPTELTAACDKGLSGAKARVVQLETRKADVGWLKSLDELHQHTEDTYYPISLLTHVHPDKAMRDAAQACDLKWQDFSSTFGQNSRVYARLKAVQPRDDTDRQYQRIALEGFEDAGVSLLASRRERAKQIADRISALSLDFDRNIRDNAVKVAFKPTELKGMPEDLIAAAPRDGTGMLLLGLDAPTYLPVIQYADDGMVRERMWRAKQDEGGEANLKLLSEIVTLRKSYAELFGYPSYNDFVLRRRMVQGTTRAMRFLDELRSVVEQGERREITVLREAKAQHLKDPGAKLERWDAEYYSERIKRERFSVDQNLFRAYFPPQESLRFVMAIAERLFGVRYTAVQARSWHPEVQAFAVTDAATGKPLAALYVDLYPRDGKYNHAAVWPFRGSAVGSGRVPQAALVVNFDRKGLTLDELETLLHEFGHALHNNLSATRFAQLAGTSTLQDFVEAPSQMLEDWVYDPKVLALFKEVCPTCKPVPTELVAQAVKARDYGKSRRYARQHLYASYDLALHQPQAPDPMSTWASMEGATPLGYVKDTRFPAGFGHIAGGYAAGYYGYLWSEVVARDMRTAFAGDKLSKTTGARYRQSVLAQGGERPPQAMVRQFLGRDSNSRAFYDYLKR